VTSTIGSTHGMRDKARHTYARIVDFLADLRKTGEQLDRLERWHRILSEALRYFPNDAHSSHRDQPIQSIVITDSSPS
jgi:hypothetical protein